MTKKEVDSLQNRAFVLDLPVMQLRQESMENPIIYQGPGSIHQSLDGDLKFKLYHLRGVELSEIFPDSKTRVGEIIPDNMYFSLKAIDSYGREWMAEHIMFSKTICSSNEAIIINGNLNSLQNKKILSQSLESAFLTLRFPQNIKIPCRKATKKYLGGES